MTLTQWQIDAGRPSPAPANINSTLRSAFCCPGSACLQSLTMHIKKTSPMSVQCWASVAENGPTSFQYMLSPVALNQCWFNVVPLSVTLTHHLQGWYNPYSAPCHKLSTNLQFARVDSKYSILSYIHYQIKMST